MRSPGRIERVPIDALHEDPVNLRRHPDRNLEAIAASLARFGQQVPLVATAAGRVVAGNGRLAAMRQLGWTHADVVRTTLDGDALETYAIADNRTAELAVWDYRALSKLLAGMHASDAEVLAAAGFTATEMQAIAAAAEEVPLTPDAPLAPTASGNHGDILITLAAGCDRVGVLARVREAVGSEGTVKASWG